MKLGNGRREYTQLRNDWQARDAQDDDLPELDDAIPPVPDDSTVKFGYEAAKRAVENTEMPAGPEDCSSVLGAGSVWNGNFNTEGSVRLDGQVSGEVKAAGTVHISEGAEVNATIHAKYIVIGGSFDGQLYCSERLQLLPQSKVRGSMTTRSLSVGEGAFIDGEIRMVDEVPAVATKPLSSSFASLVAESGEPNGTTERQRPSKSSR